VIVDWHFILCYIYSTWICAQNIPLLDCALLARISVNLLQPATVKWQSSIQQQLSRWTDCTLSLLLHLFQISATFHIFGTHQNFSCAIYKSKHLYQCTTFDPISVDLCTSKPSWTNSSVMLRHCKLLPIIQSITRTRWILFSALAYSRKDVMP